MLIARKVFSTTLVIPAVRDVGHADFAPGRRLRKCSNLLAHLEVVRTNPYGCCAAARKPCFRDDALRGVHELNILTLGLDEGSGRTKRSTVLGEIVDSITSTGLRATSSTVLQAAIRIAGVDLLVQSLS